ncbi:MAG: choloylglycine hydrolase family protein [Lachnospiraceae bacterium]|nr:choloylglycine hydrolase family protein [Lachnospiraceae bacterium]
MCTAISYKNKNHYFGRNLDLEYSYKESVTITPRQYPFHFKRCKAINNHYGIIGMAYVQDNYPLYYDATNEAGLSMAGLNFPDNAEYFPEIEGKDNITPFEFIPWILSQCKNIDEAKKLLEKMNMVNISYSEQLSLSPLHWIISDREKSITVESVSEGLKVYDNPVGVLTNNPTFPYHMMNLNNYMSLSVDPPGNNFSEGISMNNYSRGMGALGLPGDWSSASRFVRATFVKENSVAGTSEEEEVSQFFHILDSVAFPRGVVRMKPDLYEITIYSSCCDTKKGIYYYKTYDNPHIKAVDMRKVSMESSSLISYPLYLKE